VFVGLSSPNLSQLRVSQRFQDGGHDVPDEKIFARYDRVMALLPQAIQVADRSLIYDNSKKNQPATLIAYFSNGELQESFDNIPAWLQPCI
jgi:predicted ABC-type ATPase